MPNPTTKPNPSPKPPPVCKKGTIPSPTGPVPYVKRILAAWIFGTLAQTGLPAAINHTMRLNPDPTAYDWSAEQTVQGFDLAVWVLKNDADDNYTLGVQYSVGPSPFFTHEWHDQVPKTVDPLTFADVTYNDPLTASSATLRITT